MGCLLKEYKLYPYQQEGLAFALKHHYCIIGDSMGLGKTIQAIEVMKSIPQVKALVVCPAFLKESWAREIKNFSTMTPYISKKGGLPPEDENIVVIIGYSQLKDADLLFQWADIVTADECHYLKNIDAKRTLYFHDYLQRHRPYRFIGLSGTAVKNRVPEWFSLLALCSYSPVKSNGLNILRPYPDYWSFCRKFTNVQKFKISGRWVTKFEGHKNTDELRTYLKDKYLRRKASEVLDLPPIIRKDITLDPESVDEELLQAWNERTNAFATYKKNSAKIKVNHTIHYAKSLNDAGEGPLLIYSDHVEPAKDIAEGLQNSRVITGSTPMEERDRIVQDFQAGKISVLSATIGALSVGVTLTASRNVIFNDLPWVPADLLQAEKRIHRIGQTGTCVVHRIFYGKIDATIGKTLTKKLKTLVEVL